MASGKLEELSVLQKKKRKRGYFQSNRGKKKVYIYQEKLINNLPMRLKILLNSKAIVREKKNYKSPRRKSVFLLLSKEETFFKNVLEYLKIEEKSHFASQNRRK